MKPGAEADLSESMRLALKEGTNAIVSRIERTITAGLEDRSVSIDGDPRSLAQVLHDLWLGASVMAKIHRSVAPLDTAMAATRGLQHQQAPRLGAGTFVPYLRRPVYWRKKTS